MPVTKYFPRIHSSPKQKEQILFRCDPTLQRPLRICICRPPPFSPTYLFNNGSILSTGSRYSSQVISFPSTNTFTMMLTGIDLNYICSISFLTTGGYSNTFYTSMSPSISINNVPISNYTVRVGSQAAFHIFNKNIPIGVNTVSIITFSFENPQTGMYIILGNKSYAQAAF